MSSPPYRKRWRGLGISTLCKSEKLAQYTEQFASQSLELIAQQQKSEQLTEENKTLAEELLRKEDIIKRLLNSSFGRRTSEFEI
jgi:Mn-dependent DtxR family transcriptional regulator